jgi:hypothetical protein
MSDKFIRCFCYGLEPGETVLALVEGQAVTFSYETAQIDVPLSPSATPSPIPAPAPADPGTDGT